MTSSSRVSSAFCVVDDITSISDTCHRCMVQNSMTGWVAWGKKIDIAYRWGQIMVLTFICSFITQTSTYKNYGY